MSETLHVDCLVIGAGPAGSAAAIDMAREGLKVLVIDRGEFPRFRIGESFLPRTKRALRRLGVRTFALPARCVPYSRTVTRELWLTPTRGSSMPSG